MAGKKRTDSRLASVSEVLSILKERNKDGELGYEQKLAYEYAQQFAKMSESEAKKAKKELEELGIDEKLALKFIEILPQDANLVKLILAMDKNRQPPTDETVAKIIEIAKSHLS